MAFDSAHLNALYIGNKSEVYLSDIKDIIHGKLSLNSGVLTCPLGVSRNFVVRNSEIFEVWNGRPWHSKSVDDFGLQNLCQRHICVSSL